MIFDYTMLRILWWFFLGLLLLGFTLTRGLDLGLGMLFPWLGKTDAERSAAIAAIGMRTRTISAVYFVQGGAVLFAAWSVVYAVAFSALWFALLLVLFVVFWHPLWKRVEKRGRYPFFFNIGRSKKGSVPFSSTFSSVGSFVPAFVVGVGVANLLLGLPFYLQANGQIMYSGAFWQLFSPFALLVGLLSVSMLVMRGAIYLQIKTVNEMHATAKKMVFIASLTSFVLFAIASHWVAVIDGYHISSEILSNAHTNPLAKTVKRAPGLWLDNYGHVHGLWAIPGGAVIALLLSCFLSQLNRPKGAFIFSSIATVAIVLTVSCSLFPFIIPSSLVANHSLTIWDASASLHTLSLMFGLTVVLLPLMLVHALIFLRAAGEKGDATFLSKCCGFVADLTGFPLGDCGNDGKRKRGHYPFSYANKLREWWLARLRNFRPAPASRGRYK